ncbi:MAG TPA: peptide chain release factor N(5)-glutamine methyltransferase [Patescibacteria group bacterium]|jgi:release factor glutamine methyltransferase|nr:peptide chain release factor N(5)-glutamine methyltransferase [Patescibacteria group bacterium]
MTIREWLSRTSNEFADALIPSAGLDAEIILAHTLNKPRTWLHAHSDDELDGRRKDIADARAELRLERIPVAYIIGHKEFYGRRFYVTIDVLIPRPESEALIELLNDYMPKDAKNLVDVGTGSGCLGITAKLEHPDLDVTLIDTSKAALAVARKNATTYHATVRTIEASLLDEYPLKAACIIANLPYVDPTWPELSPELKAEPAEALYAPEHGLRLISTLLTQVPSRLASGGILLLEADPRQHAQIIEQATSLGLTHIETRDFAVALRME